MGEEVSVQQMRLSIAEFEIEYPEIAALSTHEMGLRLSIIQMFNARLGRVFDLIDYGSTRANSPGWRVRRLKRLIFSDVKKNLLTRALGWTQHKHDGGRMTVTLDRSRALLSRDKGLTSPGESDCFFVQAFQQIFHKPSSMLRAPLDSKERLFNVKFRGEDGTDWGGVFREGMTVIVEDLFADGLSLSLFLPCPNATHEHGLNMDKFVPNPRQRSSLALEMFQFVGKLMGVSLRYGLNLPFEFPSFVWKQLLGETITFSDWRTIDLLGSEAALSLLHCDTKLEIHDEDQFQEMFPELSFVSNSTDGQEVELVPRGATQRVTLANRQDYFDRVVRYHLNEFNLQISAIRRGLANVVPLKVLKLYTWNELEVQISGSPEIDFEVLKSHTTYEGFTETDAVIERFWAVFKSLGTDERTKWIRFVWG